MFAWQATVQDEFGNAVLLPVVTVYLEDGLTLADIYDESGDPLPNPMTGTLEGFVQFWAESGNYKIIGADGPAETSEWNVFLGEWSQPYSNRAAMIAKVSGLPDYVTTVSHFISNGFVIEYSRKAGSTVIPDLNGWSPSSGWSFPHFGAFGDGSTDDGVAINAALASFKVAVEASLSADQPIILTGLGLAYKTTISLNATGITGWQWSIVDVQFIGFCTGKAVFDMVGSRGGYFSKVQIYGDSANQPAVGWQLARASIGGAEAFASSHKFNHCFVDGFFTKTAFYGYGYEVCHFDHCRFWNRNSTGRAAILTGYDTSMTSDYLAPMSGHTSFICNKYTNTEFRYIPIGNISSISGITSATQAVVTTSSPHPHTTGQVVTLSQLGGAASVFNSVKSVITVLSTTSYRLDSINTTSLGVNYVGTGIGVVSATYAPVLFSRGDGHNFDSCYIVAYGTPSIELAFPVGYRKSDTNTFDFLFEGAPSHLVSITGITSDATFTGFDFTTLAALPDISVFTTDALSPYLVRFLDSNIRIASFPYGTKQVFDPSKVARFSVVSGSVYAPNIASMDASLLANYGGNYYESTTGLTVFRKPSIIDGVFNSLMSSGSIGYKNGVGAGGIVTQLTSKTTAVTINKYSGTIVTHNELLAAGASAIFDVNNSNINGLSGVIVGVVRTNNNYSARVISISAGRFSVELTNRTASDLSDAVSISFNIIAGTQT